MRKVVLTRVSVILALFVMLLPLPHNIVHGLSNQQGAFFQGAYMYDADDGSGSVATCGGTSGSGGGTTTTVLNGTDNQSKIMNYLIGKGFTNFQAAGVVGNLMGESGANPTAIEGGSGAGHGIVQWSFERWKSNAVPGNNDPPGASTTDTHSLYGAAAIHNLPWQDLGLQLDFLWSELQPDGARPNVLTAMKASTTVVDATTTWYNLYEQPGSQDTSLPARLQFANTALTAYGGGTGSSTSSPSSPSACSSVGAIDCSTANTTAAVADLSQIRKNVVCLAQKELATVWTPLPAIPRLQFYKYSDNVPEEWCADFVSWIYKQGGDPFTGGSSGGWRLPAVDQVRHLPDNNQAFHWHPASGYTPRPGDLAVHQENGHSHVNLVVSVTGSVITLIGGDQGSGPYGTIDSASIVSQVIQQNSTSSNTSGYVSPDN